MSLMKLMGLMSLMSECHGRSSNPRTGLRVRARPVAGTTGPASSGQDACGIVLLVRARRRCRSDDKLPEMEIADRYRAARARHPVDVDTGFWDRKQLEAVQQTGRGIVESGGAGVRVEELRHGIVVFGNHRGR